MNVMTDAIASSLGSMKVGYELLAIALHAAPVSVSRNARGLRYGFSHFEQSRNTVLSQVVEMQIFNAEDLAGTSKKRR
jgi:hypothetical protein